ncbi:VanZ like family protein [Flavobacterium sp. CF108]|uniref:VanZ family protein n=1 Tax=unclassified Flavobacterium TaxID=196869 RepID=UPI0008AF79D1|nr:MULTISPECIES: VanZ family protein [unclassified Flavobacterium]SEN99278.1 VanZ like family protein [Flavobacterium sp. fv08]SHH34214.1 VanZ like family protein [Flavobacterium sp. CF108]
MFQKIVLLILLFVIGVVFYFSWLPDPSLRTESYLPRWLLNWSNHYYNLRTAVPFLAVGFLLEAYVQQKSPNETNQSKNLNFIQNIGIAAIIVCIAEGGQFIVQKRNPDIMDVCYGIIGSIAGGLFYNLFKKFKKCETDINLPS